MKVKSALAHYITVFIICTVAFCLAYINRSATSEYSGKVVFLTENEYTQFKEVMADPRVRYDAENMSVLSSSPPIVVSFRITTPSSMEMPYGRHSDGVLLDMIVSLIITTPLIALGLFYLTFWAGGGVENKECPKK